MNRDTPPDRKRRNSKSTMRSTHPKFTERLVEIVESSFKSALEFTSLAGIHPTRYYAFLRVDKAGACPKMQTVSTIIRTVHKHAPDKLESLVEALLEDIHPDLALIVTWRWCPETGLMHPRFTARG